MPGRRLTSDLVAVRDLLPGVLERLEHAEPAAPPLPENAGRPAGHPRAPDNPSPALRKASAAAHSRSPAT